MDLVYQVTVFYDYPLYIFFIFMVVGAQFQEFTVFKISPVCERSIIDKILNQSFLSLTFFPLIEEKTSSFQRTLRGRPSSFV